MKQLVYKKHKINMFLFFLACAAVLWFLVKLSETYTSTVDFKVVYKDVPANKILHELPAETINVRIKATGFRLLYHYIFGHKVTISLTNVKEENNTYYLDKVTLLSILEKQLSKNTVENIYPDTLYFNLETKQEKQVPVKTNLELSLAENHKIFNDIEVTPKTVTINGPNSVLDTIDALYTQLYKAENVREDINILLPIIVPNIEHISVSPKQVTVKASIKLFSEKTITVPVQVVNAPDSILVKTYPSEVKVLCKAPLKELKELSPADFTLVADYSDSIAKTSNYIPLRLLKKPKTVSDIKLLQEQVQYIVKRL